MHQYTQINKEKIYIIWNILTYCMEIEYVSQGDNKRAKRSLNHGHPISHTLFL